ncbi:MAG: hypothetical protein ABIP49_00490 [Lysobacterales bacterium]
MTKIRSRSQALLIAAIFAAPLVAAWWLFASGWKPAASRNHGYLYAPAQDFRGVSARTATGRDIVWENPERRWHLLLIAPPECDARCASMLDTVRRVWVGLGRHASDVELHFVGTPDAAARTLLSRHKAFDVVSLTAGALPPPAASGAGLPVYLVDPHGYLVMRFDAGFEPGGLRRDLQRLLR